MDQHVAVGERFELLPIIVDMSPLVVEAGAGELPEILVRRD